MKNTVNIFEELNKMKNLIHVKRGTIISEQSDPFSCIKSSRAEKGQEVQRNEIGSLTFGTHDGRFWEFKKDGTWYQKTVALRIAEFTGEWKCTGNSSYEIISKGERWPTRS